MKNKPFKIVVLSLLTGCGLFIMNGCNRCCDDNYCPCETQPYSYECGSYYY